jgi:hypothetical protein
MLLADIRLLQFASVEIPIEAPVKTLEVHTAATATKYVKISHMVDVGSSVITPKRSINLLLVLAWE